MTFIPHITYGSSKGSVILLWVRGAGLTVHQLGLYNSSGQAQVVKTIQGGTGNSNDVSQLSPGIYFLKAKGVSDWPTSSIFIR